MPLSEEKAYPGLLQSDVSDQIRALRNGSIRGTHIPDLAARVGVSQDYLLSQLRLPKSTIASRISRDEALSALEQDRIYRVERVLARACQVLGQATGAQEWICRPNRSLGGEAPLSLLDTEAGYELVLDTLGRIEYGVYS